MSLPEKNQITDTIGNIPYRMAFAGGWIDQPFLSKLNPSPPGSMVVVSLEPVFPVMDRCGMATSTRKIAMKMYKDGFPDKNPAELVEELYEIENRGKNEPSGSQDMIGLIYPGVNRLDFDYSHKGGIFPVHIESNNNPEIAHWLERVVKMVPVSPRPDNYNPLGIKNLDPEWITQLGKTGKDCYEGIINMDIEAFGASMNDCMKCWKTILPQTVKHPALTIDLLAILNYYKSKYHGAMYSGCGGGYLYVLSEEPVPGGITVKVRTGHEKR